MGFLAKMLKGDAGGMMDVIRCDEPSYLIWKWRPKGAIGETSKENSIRYGSSLRVKDGEAAVFVYKQKNGAIQDFIIGPYDETIRTANFPILSSIVGAAFGGESPFQAEIYFINLAGNIQVKFGVPYFDVFDPRFPDHGVPVSVLGTITFNLTDYKSFIKLNRLINFELEDFKKQIKDAVIRYVKGRVSNIPCDDKIPVVQIERKIAQINDIILTDLKPRLKEDFGVNLKNLDIANINVDKESDGYIELKGITADITSETVKSQAAVNIKNIEDMQKINAENLQETLRVNREEAQRSQKLQTETNFIGAHALNQQTEVLKTAAESLGSMGGMNIGGESGGGMNPAGMMTGMMMGGAMGQQMAGMMNQMGQQIQQPNNTPPPIPNVQYMVANNGQQSGPYNIQQLQQLLINSQLTKQTLVWKQGMEQWDCIANIAELSILFGGGINQPPPIPQ